jgi:hypothetical protein
MVPLLLKSFVWSAKDYRSRKRSSHKLGSKQCEDHVMAFSLKTVGLDKVQKRLHQSDVLALLQAGHMVIGKDIGVEDRQYF